MSLPVLSLQQGLINLGAGTYQAESIIHCESDTGDLVLTWEDGSTTSYSMVRGEDRAIYDVITVEIVSGTFTMARQ